MTDLKPWAGISEVIARVRRVMPRNDDVMAVCDFAQRSVTEQANVALQDFHSNSNVTCEQCARRKKQTAERVARHRKRVPSA